jgi:predicted ATPase
LSLAGAWHFASVLHLLRGEPLLAQEAAEVALRLSDEHGFAFFSALGAIDLGAAIVAQGRVDEGASKIEEGARAYSITGSRLWRPYFLGLLAHARGNAGHVDEGLVLVFEGLDTVNKTNERWCQAELYRVEGDLLLLRTGANEDEAEGSIRKAITTAREQRSRSFELRATMSLARLLRDTGRRDEARAMLADIYNWFTEGFDTADLKDAKALLDELSA